MTDNVHEITDVKKSWKSKLPSRKSAMKWGSVAVVGTCLALVGYDKLNSRTSKTTHTVTETEETTES